MDPGRPVDSLDQLFAAAAAAHPLLLERARAWAAASGGRFPAGRGAGLKSVERAVEKIVRVYRQVVRVRGGGGGVGGGGRRDGEGMKGAGAVLFFRRPPQALQGSLAVTGGSAQDSTVRAACFPPGFPPRMQLIGGPVEVGGSKGRAKQEASARAPGGRLGAGAIRSGPGGGAPRVSGGRAGLELRTSGETGRTRLRRRGRAFESTHHRRIGCAPAVVFGSDWCRKRPPSRAIML